MIGQVPAAVRVMPQARSSDESNRQLPSRGQLARVAVSVLRLRIIDASPVKTRCHATPSFTQRVDWAGSPVNFAILDSQNLRAETFFSMMRICHRPGQWSHTFSASW